MLGDADILVTYLLDHPGFHTAKSLGSALSYNDRTVRKLAEASRGIIVSGPGSPGYCHLHHCPTEQLGHIADTLRSQARSMLRRSIALRKQAHSLIR